MKLEPEKTSIFRNLIGLLIDNWGLKLISLALAIVIYHSMKSEHHANHFNNDRNIFIAS